MNRKESDALCREITGLHSEGRWLEANERLWQAIGAVQITPEQEAVLKRVLEWHAGIDGGYQPSLQGRLLMALDDLVHLRKGAQCPK